MRAKELPEIEKYVQRPNRIFPRCPIPKPKELQRNIQRLALLEGASFEESLYRYLRARVGEVLSSYEILLREHKRVMKLRESMKVLLSLIDDEEYKEWVAYDIQMRCGINLSENL